MRYHCLLSRQISFFGDMMINNAFFLACSVKTTPKISIFYTFMMTLFLFPSYVGHFGQCVALLQP